MKSLLQFLFIFVLFTCFTSHIYSQEYGKIFNSSEAESLFGKVEESYSINNDALISYLKKTEKVVMFTLENNQLTILGDKRRLILGSEEDFDAKTVFHTFSVSLVEELIELGKKNIIYIENRVEVLTITCGEFTLELSFPCPPFCG
jgi:hypothetical protein